MYETLKGRTAVVTGASRGLGRGLCKYLAEQGIKVAGVSRNEAELIELKKEIELAGGEFFNYCFDIRDYNSIEKMAADLSGKWGRIDILVNNAGVINLKPLEEMTQQIIDDMLDINLKGTIYFTRHIAPLMMKAKSGCILNVTSTSALRGLKSSGVYFASKHGQRGFADSISKYLADYNIHVITLCPGGMDTPFWRNEWERDPNNTMMKVPEIIKIVDMVLSGSPGTLIKEIVMFPIGEADLW